MTQHKDCKTQIRARMAFPVKSACRTEERGFRGLHSPRSPKLRILVAAGVVHGPRWGLPLQQ
jgi:hypothetical protein